MIELKIYKKYFDAILRLEKPFELRQKPIPKGSIVKLNCIENGRYIIFKSGECAKTGIDIENKIIFANDKDFSIYGDGVYTSYYDWFDDFCGNYINKKQTYLIEIAEILEVK